jgi:hypothetical protein
LTNSSSGQRFELTRLETATFAGSDDPALTVVGPDWSPWVTIVGNEQRDFSVQFCGLGVGNSEAEARQHLQAVGLTVNKNVVSLTNSLGPPRDQLLAGGALLVEGPANASTVIHTNSAVEVFNMRGPVRVASGGLAEIVNTTGEVNVDADMISFAASRGRVTLTSTSGMRLAMTTKFDGTLDATAHGGIQLLVPSGFQTPFRVIVNRESDFLCVTDLCSKMIREKEGPRFVFTYAGDGSAPPERISLRMAEPDYSSYFRGGLPQSKVLIDKISNVTLKSIESGVAAKQ